MGGRGLWCGCFGARAVSRARAVVGVFLGLLMGFGARAVSVSRAVVGVGRSPSPHGGGRALTRGGGDAPKPARVGLADAHPSRGLTGGRSQGSRPPDGGGRKRPRRDDDAPPSMGGRGRGTLSVPSPYPLRTRSAGRVAGCVSDVWADTPPVWENSPTWQRYRKPTYTFLTISYFTIVKLLYGTKQPRTLRAHRDSGSGAYCARVLCNCLTINAHFFR